MKRVHIPDIYVSVKLYNVSFECIHLHWQRYHNSFINAVISEVLTQIDEKALMKII